MVKYLLYFNFSHDTENVINKLKYAITADAENILHRLEDQHSHFSQLQCFEGFGGQCQQQPLCVCV